MWLHGRFYRERKWRMMALRYIGCFAAYCLVMILYHRSKLWFRLLPYAGEYAYCDGYRDFAENRRSLMETTK